MPAVAVITGLMAASDEQDSEFERFLQAVSSTFVILYSNHGNTPTYKHLYPLYSPCLHLLPQVAPGRMPSCQGVGQELGVAREQVGRAY